MQEPVCTMEHWKTLLTDTVTVAWRSTWWSSRRRYRDRYLWLSIGQHTSSVSCLGVPATASRYVWPGNSLCGNHRRWTVASHLWLRSRLSSLSSGQPQACASNAPPHPPKQLV